MADYIEIELTVVEPVYLELNVEPVQYIGTAQAGPQGEKGDPGPIGDAYNEKFTITEAILAQKYVTIAGTVSDNQSIRVFVEHVGLKAEQGVDYSYSGNEIFWTSYDFENKLEAGDVLHVFYS